MSATFFEKKGFSGGSQYSIKSEDISNSILQNNEKLKGNFNVGGMGEINPSKDNTILSVS